MLRYILCYLCGSFPFGNRHLAQKYAAARAYVWVYVCLRCSSLTVGRSGECVSTLQWVLTGRRSAHKLQERAASLEQKGVSMLSKKL